MSALCRRPAHLVVLDNCEHVAEQSAALVGSLLASCPELRVLATSRRPLGVAGEFVRPVHPLAEDPAVALFIDRACLAGVDVASPEAAGALAAGAAVICRQLDGLPLAIELAASQVRVLTPVEIAARLDDQLRFRGRATAAAPPPAHAARDGGLELRAPPRRGPAPLRPTRCVRILDDARRSRGRGARGPRSTLRRPGRAHDARRPLVPGSRRATVDRRGTGCWRHCGCSRWNDCEESGEEDLARRAHADYFCRLAGDAGRHLYGPDERARRGRAGGRGCQHPGGAPLGGRP